jgi:hypothetical protein
MSDVRNLQYDAPAQPTVPIQGRQMINSVGLFMYAVRNSGSELAKSALDRLPTRYTGLFDPDGKGTAGNYASIPDVEVDGSGQVPTWDGTQYELMTAFDAWRNPIRLVHPALDGVVKPAQWNSPELSGILAPTGSVWGVDRISRTFEVGANPPVLAEDFGDGDSGVCEGSTPYFYSAGPDGRVGLRRVVTGATPLEFVNYDEDNVYTRQPRLTRERQIAR